MKVKTKKRKLKKKVTSKRRYLDTITKPKPPLYVYFIRKLGVVMHFIKKHFTLTNLFYSLVSIYLFSFIPLHMWDEEVNVAFVNKQGVSMFLTYIAPIISAFITVIFAYRTYKKYKREPLLYSGLYSDSKIKNFLGLLISPFIVHMIVFGPLIYGLAYVAQYAPQYPWQSEMHLQDIGSCKGMSDYGDTCFTIYLRDLRSAEIINFNWYEGKQQLQEVLGRRVFVVGTENVFGRYVDNIEW